MFTHFIINGASKINTVASVWKTLRPKAEDSLRISKPRQIRQETTPAKSNHTNGRRTKTLNLLLVEPSLHAK